MPFWGNLALSWMSVFLSLCLSVVPSTSRAAADGIDIRIGYIGMHPERPPALSNLDEPPKDEGLAGAIMGITDSNTTGRFLKQRFILEQSLGEEPLNAFSAMVDNGIKLIIADLPAKQLDALLEAAGATDLLIFNTQAEDDRFRGNDCKANLLHTAPSRAMKSDALAQFLITKRWRDWFLVTGPRSGDKLYAKAVERSAKKFGAKITERKDWTGEHDARRTAQAEVPLFTQGVDYDVLVVADEIGDFGDYLMFRTWEPKVVAGTQGLTPRSWHRVVEQWGAAQLQSRFDKQSKRWMLERDYNAWVAIRSISEAVTRTRTNDLKTITAFIKSDKFQLAAFKGRKLSFRSWNGQMRQPLSLVTARSLVAQPPLEGFLHKRTELDTLGLDEPESACRF